MKKVRIITATAKNQMEFIQMTLLGQSLSLLQRQKDLAVTVIPDNNGNRKRGLGELYNSFLHQKHKDEILLFLHDDVYIHDWYLVHRLNEAIALYDVIGLAGNTNPDYDEPSWALAWNKERYPQNRQSQQFFSGAVGHLVRGRTQISNYGPTPQECKLLDGVFLAVNTEKVLDAGIRFDTQFEFHLYDLDFCRQCSNNGLKLGTWPIAVTHASGGSFNTPEWVKARDLYLSKWS